MRGVGGEAGPDARLGARTDAPGAGVRGPPGGLEAAAALFKKRGEIDRGVARFDAD